MTPDTTNMPATITVTESTDQFDPVTQHYITVMVPKVIANPALSCSARYGDVMPVSTTVALLVVAIAVTWIARGWWKN
jgi:hypothetical protein